MFTQQKFFKKFNFDIDENGIKVENYYIFQTEKFKIYFDGFDPNPIEIKTISKKWLILSFLSGIWFVFLFFNHIISDVSIWNPIILFVIFKICLLNFLNNYNTYYVFYAKPTNLLIMKNNPNETAMVDFMNELILKYTEYHFNNNQVPNEIDEIERLNRLLNKNLINEQDYLQLKSKIIERTNPNNNFFGTSSLN